MWFKKERRKCMICIKKRRHVGRNTLYQVANFMLYSLDLLDLDRVKSS